MANTVNNVDLDKVSQTAEKGKEGELDYVYSIANNLAMLISVQLGNHLMI